ncbi:MAG: hypothetical protein ACPGFC_00610, partial [Paracoccaceae bacterium]
YQRPREAALSTQLFFLMQRTRQIQSLRHLQVEKTVTSSTEADWCRLGSCGRHKLQRRVQ